MSKEHVLDNFLNCFNFIDTENQLTTAYPIFLHLGYTEESAKAVLSEPMIYQYTNKDGFAPQKYAFISIKQIRELIVNAPKSKYISHILNFIDTKLTPLFIKEVAVVELELVPKADNIKTMSSLEIAELTGKLHKHVLRDIEKLINELGTELKIGLSEYKDKTGRKLKCYNLDRESATLLTSGYSAQLRLKIIRRLDELESGRSVPQITPPTKAADQAQVLALPTNYKEALLALVAKEDETDHLKQANLQLHKTKQLISSKREASVMGKLGQATQEIKRLKVELEESKAKEFSVLSKPRRMVME